jgi:hypothetical protein
MVCCVPTVYMSAQEYAVACFQVIRTRVHVCTDRRQTRAAGVERNVLLISYLCTTCGHAQTSHQPRYSHSPRLNTCMQLSAAYAYTWICTHGMAKCCRLRAPLSPRIHVAVPSIAAPARTAQCQSLTVHVNTAANANHTPQDRWAFVLILRVT